MTRIFSRFLRIDLPERIICEPSGTNPEFEITFVVDGEIPFPQLILRAGGQEHLIKDRSITLSPTPIPSSRRTRSHKEQDIELVYVASVPSGILGPGRVSVQVEGCRKTDIAQASGDDWLKEFRNLRLVAKSKPVGGTRPETAARKPRVVTKPGLRPGTVDPTPKVYFGIHKHMRILGWRKGRNHRLQRWTVYRVYSRRSSTVHRR